MGWEESEQREHAVEAHLGRVVQEAGYAESLHPRDRRGRYRVVPGAGGFHIEDRRTGRRVGSGDSISAWKNKADAHAMAEHLNGGASPVATSGRGRRAGSQPVGYEGVHGGQHIQSLYPHLYRVQYKAVIGNREHAVDRVIPALDEAHARQRAASSHGQGIRGGVKTEHVGSLQSRAAAAQMSLPGMGGPAHQRPLSQSNPAAAMSPEERRIARWDARPAESPTQRTARIKAARTAQRDHEARIRRAGQQIASGLKVLNTGPVGSFESGDWQAVDRAGAAQAARNTRELLTKKQHPEVLAADYTQARAVTDRLRRAVKQVEDGLKALEVAPPR